MDELTTNVIREKPDKHETLATIVRRFHDNLRLLEDFVTRVKPILESPPTLEKADRPYAALCAYSFREASKDPAIQSQIDTPNSLDILTAITPKDFESIGHFVVEKDNDDSLSSLTFKLKTLEHVNRLRRFVERMSSTGRHIGHLYSTSVISVVTFVESYVAELAHWLLIHNPSHLKSKDKVFNLEDLEEFDSIDDARTSLRERRVESLLHGSFEDWCDFLSKRAGLSMGYLENTKPDLTEFFQRRNLLVHNGGVVNSLYLNRVPKEAKYRIEEMDAIARVSKEYLESSISLVRRCLTLFAAELWKKEAPGDDRRAELLISVAYEALEHERWREAETYSYFGKNDKAVPERSWLIATVNYWQSLKWQGRFNEIEVEIRKSDFSAKAETFRLAKAALLDDEIKFFEMLPDALNTNHLTIDDVYAWPLFRKIRETDGFATWSKNNPRQPATADKQELDPLATETEYAQRPEETGKNPLASSEEQNTLGAEQKDGGTTTDQTSGN